MKASDVISLRTIDPGGVEKIKKVIDTAVEKIDDLDVEVKIYTIGAPRYRIDVIGTDQKLVSNALQELINLIKEISQHENVTFSVVKK